MTENVLVCIKQEWTEVLLSARAQRSGLPSFTFNGQGSLLFPAEKTVHIVPRSHNPGLHPLPPHPCALACTTCMYGCTAPRMTHLSTLTQTQVQFSTAMKGTAYRDSTTSACQDDVMLGRPTAAVARHSLCPRISPFPRRQTPSPPPPPHILLRFPLGVQGNLTADGVSLSHTPYSQIGLHGKQLRCLETKVAWCGLCWLFIFQNLDSCKDWQLGKGCLQFLS